MKNYSITQYDSGKYCISSDNLSIYFYNVKTPTGTNRFDFYWGGKLVGSLKLGDVKKSVIDKLEEIENE